MKSKLAILGGHPLIKTKGPHYKWPPIDKQAEKEVINQLRKTISIYDRSSIFKDFEESFAKYHKRKYALLCSSGTLAIHSMFVAVGFKEGDEVICPAYTFFATVTPLLFTGAKPVLADCDENGNIDPDEVLKRVTRKTKAVVVTHMWGVPCQIDKIIEICKKHKLLLIEDCSHAHGAKYKGKAVGSFGDLAAWSLQGPKNITGGEGGILATDDSEYYYKALLLGHYNKRCKQEIPMNHPLAKFSTTGMGLKYRAHPLAVAIAYEIFKKIDKNLKTRSFFANKIIGELKKLRGLKIEDFNSNIQPSWYGLIIKYKTEDLDNLPIEKFYEALKAEGLTEMDIPGSTSPLNLLPLFQKPQILFPAYNDEENKFSYRKGDFPKAEKFYVSAIKMPVWAFKNDKKIVELYIKGIKKVVSNYKDLL